MSVLARKITRAKWEPKQGLRTDEIAADAVTADLRTTGNTLSFWRCSSSSADDLRTAFLAMASSAESLERIDIIYLEENSVHDSGLATKNTPGNTPVESLRNHHVNVEQLDLARLGTVARMVAAAHRSKSYRTMNKSDVVRVLAEAVDHGLVNLSNLKDKVKRAVDTALSVDNNPEQSPHSSRISVPSTTKPH